MTLFLRLVNWHSVHTLYMLTTLLSNLIVSICLFCFVHICLSEPGLPIQYLVNLALFITTSSKAVHNHIGCVFWLCCITNRPHCTLMILGYWNTSGLFHIYYTLGSLCSCTHRASQGILAQGQVLKGVALFGAVTSQSHPYMQEESSRSHSCRMPKSHWLATFPGNLGAVLLIPAEA